MLVLERKTGESIDIEGVGRIVVTESRDGRTTLGLEFDKSIRIRRSELPPLQSRCQPPRE